MNVAEILHGCPMFSSVDASGFQRMVTMARLVNFTNGQTIFREQQECPGVYVVGSGLVRVFKTGPGGKEHVLHVVGPGHTFAEVAAIGGFRVPASAQAVAATRCVLLPGGPLREALEEEHSLCLGMMAGMTFWVRHLVGLMEDVVLRDATGRLARYLLAAETDADGTLVLPTLKRHVASHLNLTSETFSRTLRRLVDAELIVEHDRGSVQLLDREKLRLIAEGIGPKI